MPRAAPIATLGTRTFFKLANSRWQIEHQGFNDGKNLYGMEHVQHHHPNSMLVIWLFLLLALMIERLYRNRYLHRRTHLILTAIQRRAPLPVGSLSRVRKSLAPTFRNRCRGPDLMAWMTTAVVYSGLSGLDSVFSSCKVRCGAVCGGVAVLVRPPFRERPPENLRPAVL